MLFFSINCGALFRIDIKGWHKGAKVSSYRKGCHNSVTTMHFLCVFMILDSFLPPLVHYPTPAHFRVICDLKYRQYLPTLLAVVLILLIFFSFGALALINRRNVCF